MKKVSSTLLLGVCMTIGSMEIAQAGFGEAIVGGIVGGVVSSAMNGHHGHHRYTHHHARNGNIQKRISEPMKIQIALKNLGFYRGPIDGQINSFITRTSIKNLNKEYKISDTAYLNPQEKDTLIYLGTLFNLDYNLAKTANNRHSKVSKIQTALKILGFYTGKTDGSTGPMTRKAIQEYQRANRLPVSSKLGYEQEYRLFDSAKKYNDKNIQDTINSLKHLGVQNRKSTQEKQEPPKAKEQAIKPKVEVPKPKQEETPKKRVSFDDTKPSINNTPQRPTITLKRDSTEQKVPSNQEK